jgi:8-amino-7-oxononanoate synthase
VIASTLKALQRLEEDSNLRVRLSANADQLWNGLRDLGYAVGPHASPITAVVMPDQAMAVTMWNALLANGVYLNLAIPPATPDNRPLLRSSVSAAHSREQIQTVLSVFDRLGQEFGLLQRARRASA